ncbi:Putative SANT/Myb domain, WD40/YVTN repeat-like-containing domain superfamily [Septoria linicola]|uniref:SANT/Myb domain, WD40/YVTN repeat-like-containing domain superfamily n=1 Tax=Septoria linicola TaxID=215465 RepID=A0A9Q9AP58_9PEZI|nr:Putative SANT/Myb domain, WD40/YVTN repeat-like-containing domain superfamily [Septoria linicola]
MAPAEVIDLLSSDEESPTKLLQTFRARQNENRTVAKERHKLNGVTGEPQNGTSRPFSSFALTSTIAPCSTEAQQHSLRKELSNTSSFSLGASQADSQPPILAPRAVSSAAERARHMYTPPVLSEEAWKALGSPGRKLKLDFARIQRDLDTSRRQSEPRRLERVDKAGRYQERRLSASRPQGPAPARQKANSSRQISEGAVTTANSRSIAAPAAAANSFMGAEYLHMPGSLPGNSLGIDLSSNDPGAHKRPFESPSARHSPIKKPRMHTVRDDIRQLSPSKGQIVDATDAIAERFTTSSEPEPDKDTRMVSEDDVDLEHPPRDASAATPHAQVSQQSSRPGSSSACQTERHGTYVMQNGQTGARSAVALAAPLSNAPASVGRPPGSKNSRKPFTAEDNALLKRLKSVMNLEWSKIHPYFPDRSLPTLQVHYSTKVKKMQIDVSGVVLPTTDKLQTAPAASQQASSKPLTTASNLGNPYSMDEAALLKKLKEEDHLDWKAMVPFFNGRTAGSLQVYYYTKIRQAPVRKAPDLHRADSHAHGHARSKRARKNNVAVTDGFISWTDAKILMREGVDTESTADDVSDTQSAGPFAQQDTVFPRSLGRIVRQRELGHAAGARAWMSSRCAIPEDLKNNVFKDYSLQQYYHGTSGDVVGLSWSVSGTRFAAGSIAITDNRSMQYNMSRNLLVGDVQDEKLQELVEHHVSRPMVDESDNPNSLGAMRQTQDSRLFLTVTATAFSPAEESALYTTGTDGMLRRYAVAADVQNTAVEYSAEHVSSAELLAVHQEGLVATGCHSATGSINIFSCGSTGLDKVWTGSPRRQDLQSTAAIFPSTLKWGAASVHRNHLLAGFSGDEDKLLAGETVLWDIEYQRQLELRGITRNVFDVCWNPRPSSASVVFAVASNSTGLNLGRGMRTVCPALDINDVLICPHNDQLVAAGATDGKVYVWDQRWAGNGQAPLHVLSHGESLNVLPHGTNRELTDTGVRFLSWGATSSRLYTGSSDGIVKVWNPYRSEDDTHVEDIDVPRQHRSAVMSGAFSPDYQQLLVGTENGRVNVFNITGDQYAKAKQMKLHTATAPIAIEEVPPLEPANALLRSGKMISRPCGAMPIVQVVQGEAYNGPFQAPSKADETAAVQNLQNALDDQTDLETKRAQDGDHYLREPALEKAQIRVCDAQAAVADLQDRQVFADQSRPKAEAFQAMLREARKERQKLVERADRHFGGSTTACHLDCRHLPNSEGLDDTCKSELRIPETLRLVSKAASATSPMSPKEDNCSSCCPLQAPKRGKRHQCISCKLKAMRLTTTCGRCAAPARVEAEGLNQILCEACAFACFRCAGPVTLLEDLRLVRCGACNLSWSVGILGYDLVEGLVASRTIGRNKVQHEQYDDFGAADRERLADNWTVESNDDMY